MTMKISGSDAYAAAVQGLRRASSQADSAAQRIVQGEIEPRPVVALKSAEQGFKASAAVIRTLDEMDDRLLDILA